MIPSPPIPSTSPRHIRSSLYSLIRSRSVAITWNLRLELPELRIRTFIEAPFRLSGGQLQDKLCSLHPAMRAGLYSCNFGLLNFGLPDAAGQDRTTSLDSTRESALDKSPSPP